MIIKEFPYCTEITVQGQCMTNTVLITLCFITHHCTYKEGDACRTLCQTHSSTLRHTQQGSVPEIGLFSDILLRVDTIKLVLENPSRGKDSTRKPLFGYEFQILVCVETTSTETPATPNINTYIDITFSGGEWMDENVPISGILSRGDQIVGLPPVVQKDAITVVEIDAIFGVELILVVERAICIDGVVPNNLAFLRKSLEFEVQFFEEFLQRSNKRSRNGTRFDIHEITVEVGLLAERGEAVCEERIESRWKRGRRCT